ncbi:MAG: PD40 domain-containing protein, partial [Anaerolineae bacterium]|nr:PD40 domain-containing protein [Anaerolineae bacterium]
SWSPDNRYLALSPGLQFTTVDLIEVTNGRTSQFGGLAYPPPLRGWSPDGRYLVLDTPNVYDQLTVMQAETGIISYTTRTGIPTWDFANRWSPDSQWLAYVWDMGTETGLVIAAADGSVEQRYLLGQYDYLSDHHLLWSPDSQQVALRYTSSSDGIQGDMRLTLFGIDGSSQPLFLDWPLRNGDLPPAIFDTLWKLPHWSHDGGVIMDTRARSESSFALMSYQRSSGETRVVAEDLPKPAFYAPTVPRLALYRRLNGAVDVTLTDWDGGNPYALVAGAVDAGDPDWSPRGEWVAAVWARGAGESRRVVLSWAHPDGSGRQDVDADFTDVRDLHWLNGDGSIAYIAWRGAAGNSIEVVDTATGERRVLVDGLLNVYDLQYDTAADTISFWWELDDGSFGKDVYRPTGERVAHWLAAGDIERPRREFPSPDGQTMALKIGALGYRGLYDEMLMLLYADGRKPLLLRSGLAGLGDPLWSPDGQQVAFTQEIPRGGMTLEIVTADGQRVISTWDYQLGRSLEWRECE